MEEEIKDKGVEVKLNDKPKRFFRWDDGTISNIDYLEDYVPEKNKVYWNRSPNIESPDDIPQGWKGDEKERFEAWLESWGVA